MDTAGELSELAADVKTEIVEEVVSTSNNLMSDVNQNSASLVTHSKDSFQAELSVASTVTVTTNASSHRSMPGGNSVTPSGSEVDPEYFTCSTQKVVMESPGVEEKFDSRPNDLSESVSKDVLQQNFSGNEHVVLSDGLKMHDVKSVQIVLPDGTKMSMRDVKSVEILENSLGTDGSSVMANIVKPDPPAGIQGSVELVKEEIVTPLQPKFVGNFEVRTDQDMEYVKAMAEFMKEHEIDPDNSAEFTEEDIATTTSDANTAASSEEKVIVDDIAKKRREKGAFGIDMALFTPLLKEGQEGLEGTTQKRKEPESAPSRASLTPSGTSTSSALEVPTNKRQKIGGKEDENLNLSLECVKCGRVYPNASEVCACEQAGGDEVAQKSGVPQVTGSVADDKSVVQGGISVEQNTNSNTNTNSSEAKRKAKAGKASASTSETGKTSAQANKRRSQDAGKKLVKVRTNMKNARNHTITYKIPEDFSAEKCKLESAAYICAKCGHQGDINGCSCKKPAISGNKWFRYKCLEHCGHEFPNRRDYVDHERMSKNIRPFACDMCDKTFTSKNLLGKHVQVHIGEKPFTCDECHKRFMYKRDMTNHVLIHTAEKQFVCEECGKAYGCENNLMIHKLVHENKEPFRCQVCEKPFACKNQRDVHQKFHNSGKGPFPCSLCGKPFNCRSNLSRHMKRVHKQLYPDTFTCYACGDKFKKGEELMEHCRHHYTEPAQKCEACGREFTTKMELDNHKCLQQIADAKPFKCDLCKLTFVKERALERHRRTHFGEMRHTCVICEEQFQSKPALSQHLKAHIANEKGYKCRVCQKVFSGATSLIRHRFTHNIGESPHICVECGSVFSNIYKLKDHKVIHSTERPFECTVCKKSFKSKRYLMLHERIHSGTKPHVCGTCGKAFRLGSHLSIHKRTHTGDYPFKCGKCDKQFICSSNLNAHVMAVHVAMVGKRKSKKKKKSVVAVSIVEPNTLTGVVQEGPKDVYPVSLVRKSSDGLETPGRAVEIVTSVTTDALDLTSSSVEKTTFVPLEVKEEVVGDFQSGVEDVSVLDTEEVTGSSSSSLSGSEVSEDRTSADPEDVNSSSQNDATETSD